MPSRSVDSYCDQTRTRSPPESVWSRISVGPKRSRSCTVSLRSSRSTLLPPKSTRFLPKMISGMVWVGHDARLL